MDGYRVVFILFTGVLNFFINRKKVLISHEKSSLANKRFYKKNLQSTYSVLLMCFNYHLFNVILAYKIQYRI